MSDPVASDGRFFDFGLVLACTAAGPPVAATLSVAGHGGGNLSGGTAAGSTVAATLLVAGHGGGNLSGDAAAGSTVAATLLVAGHGSGWVSPDDAALMAGAVGDDAVPACAEAPNVP